MLVGDAVTLMLADQESFDALCDKEPVWLTDSVCVLDNVMDALMLLERD